jgi:hypothetical protein
VHAQSDQEHKVKNVEPQRRTQIVLKPIRLSPSSRVCYVGRQGDVWIEERQLIESDQLRRTITSPDEFAPRLAARKRAAAVLIFGRGLIPAVGLMRAAGHRGDHVRRDCGGAVLMVPAATAQRVRQELDRGQYCGKRIHVRTASQDSFLRNNRTRFCGSQAKLAGYTFDDGPE